MSLQNLNQIAIESVEKFNLYQQQEVILSSKFKLEFTEFLNRKTSDTVLFSNSTSIIETSGGLTITFPNQWYFIASYFTEFLNALKEYKKNYNSIFKDIPNAKEITKQIKVSGLIPSDIETKIDGHFSEAQDKEFFIKFISDYSWWHGNKTIDRSDYFVSPVLSLSKVVNVSQSYIADLTFILSEEPSLLNALRESIVSKVKPANSIDESSKEELIEENSSIRDFALNVFKYFFGQDWSNLISQTKTRQARINSTNFISHNFEIFSRLIAEFTQPQNKEGLTSASTQRYFEQPIYSIDDRYFYFSTQWNGEGDYDLSFDSLKEYFEKKHPDYRFEKNDRTYKLIKQKSRNQIAFYYKLFYNKAKETNLSLPLQLSTRFISSLLTKPFVILTGLSGSGKTKLAQAFAKWICEDESQYCMVPVGADWTTREPLLGFPNALKQNDYVKPDNKVLDLIIDANKNQDKPYFLILDEMNLSHVERYFADFLSVMESKGKISLHAGSSDWNGVPSEINFPKNLFIIGTVNIDETTYMFSPKVLDRASVIEFRVTKEEMGEYLKSNSVVNLENLEAEGSDMAQSFVSIAKDMNLEADDAVQLKITLLKFFSELKKTGAEFGYRTASEVLRFAAVIKKLEAGWNENEILDAAIMQKLLPKVHGSRRKLEPVLKTLGSLCLIDANDIETLIIKTEIAVEDKPKIKYAVSFEKIQRMYQNLISNSFTSYAEA